MILFAVCILRRDNLNFIAHIRNSDKGVQTVESHLIEVKKLAESYGEKIGIKHVTGLAGLLHDLGKYTHEFREYILEAVKNPDNPPKRGSVDHSTAGGKLLYNYFHTKNNSPYEVIVAEIVGNAIISHHASLQDYFNSDLESNYLLRVRDKEITEFLITKDKFFEHVMSEQEFRDYVHRAVTEMEQIITQEPLENCEKRFMFLTKFVFSALIDADRTNTRLFEENEIDEKINSQQNLMNTYHERLISKINSLEDSKDANSPINLLRTAMSEQCEIFAERPSGIYTLSIPTGGGKTLASLRYALKHASIYKKKRIIYVVPYTTIIEQNAEEVRKILKDDANILEHHSNIIEDDNDNDENEDGVVSKHQILKLAKDNWDSPIIFTTMVQFLNVFYEKGSRNTRRLHNLSESIIIFDEVQKVPIKCVSLFNHAVNFLVMYCHSSIVLCTATQPALDFVEHKLEINTDAEIITNLDNVIKAFKRVEIIDKATNETFNNEKLSQFIKVKMEEVQSVLVILNTKSVVKDLYVNHLEDDIPKYHLSTSMCAAHRQVILKEIKKQLEAKNRIICVSTQLIEAGVDVSFECVIRSLAGLDSIAQAAGRCNRHGENDIQKVYVIDHEEEKLDRLKEIRIGKRIAKKILVDIRKDNRNHGGHLLSSEAMQRYFKEYYTELETDLNYFIPKLRRTIIDLLISSKEDNAYYQAYLAKTREYPPIFIANSYKTAAEHFNVIDNNTTAVIVPYKDGEKIIADLNGNQKIDDLTKLLRKAQHYTINLYDHELRQLSKNKGLEYLFDGKIYVLKQAAYDKEFGFTIENDSPFELIDF